MWTGRRALGIEALGAESLEEVINRGRELVKRQKPPPGAYVWGDGVNPELFTSGEKRDLRREDIDKISSEHPVILNRHCGHTVYCNSLALKLAGLSDCAPAIEGGTVEKDESGKPTGVFRENATILVYKPVPATTRKDMKDVLRLAMKKAHSLGICGCGSNDPKGSDFENILEAYREIYDEERKQGTPGLRVAMQCGISASEEMLNAYLNRDINLAPLWEDAAWGTFLKMSSIKLFVDGSLGGHTAWMRNPYRDKPETRGFPVLSQDTLELFVKKASAGGMQVLIHAIGDAGMDAAITAIEKVTRPKENPLRHGIIHCQITSGDLLERMAERRILALVQPIFLADDIHILESRVGPDLASTSYAWLSMLRLGVPVSFSTDAPVSPLDPLPNIEWAVLHRETERVDVYSAVDNYTEAAAFANFYDDSVGRIAPGYLADLVFLDKDIFTIPPEDIHKAKVLRTMCAGETVYNA
jgi:hypothetical protein